MTDITPDIVRKLIETVDAGLCAELGKPIPGKMCVEAALCYALGLPHGDKPPCVSLTLRALKIRLNDADWSSDQARAKGMRKLAVLQLGSAGVLDARAFVRRLVPLVEAAASDDDDGMVAAGVRWTAYAATNTATDAAAIDAAITVDAAARTAATATAADAILTKFADDVADILIEMQVPGVQWLPLLD